MTSTPDEADEADVAEQQRSVAEDDASELPTPPTAALDEANEADVLEQGAEVGLDDDER
jgi:hypothetical protein